MVARSILLRHIKRQNVLFRSPTPRLRLASTQFKPVNPTTAQKSTQNIPVFNPERKSWLTRKVESSPTTKRVFLGVAKILGYGSPKQIAGQRSFAIYEQICAVKPDEDKEFWETACYLPPTFQSWFTITNLHIWMLTVRLRALPAEHGRNYQQAIIDHFFIDIEDRIRAVLQPPPEPTKPYTFHSSFYINPNAPPASTSDSEQAKKYKRSRAPDRIVNRQMKIFKEQWAGMGLSFDLGLVKGDQELAGAVWRNLLGARGAQGIDYASEPTDAGKPKFRRSVNLVGGEVVDVTKIDLEAEEARDDGSGVHDFAPSEVDRYLTYPDVMLDVVGYVRRELKRLEGVSDEDIIEGAWKKLRFGRVNSEA